MLSQQEAHCADQRSFNTVCEHCCVAWGLTAALGSSRCSGRGISWMEQGHSADGIHPTCQRKAGGKGAGVSAHPAGPGLSFQAASSGLQVSRSMVQPVLSADPGPLLSHLLRGPAAGVWGRLLSGLRGSSRLFTLTKLDLPSSEVCGAPSWLQLERRRQLRFGGRLASPRHACRA